MADSQRKQLEIFARTPCDCAEKVADITMLIDMAAKESLVLRQDAAREVMDYLRKLDVEPKCVCEDFFKLNELRSASSFAHHLMEDKTFHPIKRGYFLLRFYDFLTCHYAGKK